MNEKLIFTRLFAATAVLALAGAFFFWGGSYAVRANTTDLPLEELRLFSDIYGRVKHNYVEDVDDEKLIKGAINGMLNKLDPYSAYLEKNSYENLKIDTSGKFGGIGIEVDMEDGLVKVIAPIDDTPAQRAGLQSGDLIAKIDDKQVKGMTLSDAVSLMRGEIGTTIALLILREGEADPLEVELERAVIKVKSTRGALLEPGYGYVRISKFQERAAKSLLKSINQLKKENGEPLRGLILDLRSNPGGVLMEAVKVADTFLEPDDLIVYTKGRRSNAASEYKATTPDRMQGVPLVLLINGGSASASEIVAGALQDLKRATIMGSKSFGKGSVQTIHPLDKNSALKLTTARYYTPEGRMIHGTGIMPDVVLEHVKLSDEDIEKRNSISRNDLKARLAFDSQVHSALDKLKLLAEQK